AIGGLFQAGVEPAKAVALRAPVAQPLGFGLRQIGQRLVGQIVVAGPAQRPGAVEARVVRYFLGARAVAREGLVIVGNRLPVATGDIAGPGKAVSAAPIVGIAFEQLL